MKRRLFCAFLCVVLLAGLCGSAFAEEVLAPTEETLPAPSENLIPTPVAAPQVYTGNAIDYAGFFSAEEPVLDENKAELCAVNGKDVTLEPVAICNAGTYSLRFCAKEGYAFAEPDDCCEFGVSCKTVEVTVLPAVLVVPAVEVKVAGDEPFAAEDFFSDGEAKDKFLSLAQLTAVNGGKPSLLSAPGTYEATYTINNSNYVFAEPDDASVPSVKTVELVLALTVKFDMTGLPGGPEDQVLTKGSKVTEPATPVVEGYEFEGWFKEIDYINFWDFKNDTVTGDTTIFGKFTPYYSVRFDVQGHGTAPAEQRIRVGELVQVVEAPVAEGLEFAGWYKERECVNEWIFDEDQVRENTELYAKWLGGDLTVHFDAQGHGTAPADQQVCEGALVEEPAGLVEEGFVFGGWYQDADCTTAWDFESDTVSADMTLYAKWTKLCKVTFNVKGHGTAPADQFVLQGSKIVKPTNPKATGYFFVGWYKDSACKTQWKFNTDTVKEDTVLYARWTSTNPKTGDSDNLGLYAVLSISSLAIAAVVILGNRKRREK